MSVLVPMYQGESAPTHIRGAIVCCYQLFITIGILIAYLINFGTETISNTASWRIPMGIGYLFPMVLGFGILLFPETPRFHYSIGKIDHARTSIAKFHGVGENHKVVHQQMAELQEKLEAEESGGDHPWYEVFTGPRMFYRVLLGVAIQAFQQLSGANYFFYYGTTIFASVGISNSFVTQIILGAVNVVMTFPGLYMVEKWGRRKCLIAGALWMAVCFLIFASLGHFKLNNADGTSNQSIGYAMIVFACLFIAAFASTWGPMAWAVVAEMYPGRYRSTAIAFCSASNWFWNFYLGFFTPLITDRIDFAYGYVFAGCNLAAACVVYFFLLESNGKSLEEIDTMYLLHVSPRKSSKWEAPVGEDLVTADKLMLNAGGRGISKRAEAGRGNSQHVEGGLVQ
jgi:SP family sugar:H+ symporter-like MFS transporter